MKKCGKATCAQSSRVLFYNTVKPRLLHYQNSIYFLALSGFSFFASKFSVSSNETSLRIFIHYVIIGIF